MHNFTCVQSSVDEITSYPKFLSHNPSSLKSEEMEALGSTGDLVQEPCDLLMCVYRNPDHRDNELVLSLHIHYALLLHGVP